MRSFITLLMVSAFLAATTSSRAEGNATAPIITTHPAPGPHFINRGKPLDAVQIADLNQRIVLSGRISRDAGGEDDDIPRADAVFMGIVIIVVVGGLIYLTVVGVQDGFKRL